MNTPVSPRFIKQEAKKLKYSQGIPMSKALDEISKRYGFFNYRHYLNVYISNLKQSDSAKKAILKYISLEKNVLKIIELLISFTQDHKTPFRDILDILKPLQHSEEALQNVCQKLNLMKNEIKQFLFSDFLTEEGQYEINFRAPSFIAKEISISDLCYEINGNKLYVDGNYILTTEFELDEAEPLSNDERFKDRQFDGHFEVEINKNKKIILVHSDMSTGNGLTPMHGFTEEEIEDYYNDFPNERGGFDNMLVIDEPNYDLIKHCHSNNEPLTGKTLGIALDLTDVLGDDEQSMFVRNISTKIKE